MTHPARTYRLIASVIAGLLIAVAARAQAPGWQTYSYPSDGFSASYPSQPQLSSKEISTDAGPFELRSYMVEAGDVALFVGVCDYGSKASGNDPDQMLQGAKNGALSNSKSHLITERRITLGVYPGLAFESESDDGSAHFTARVYMVGTTLYQTLVVNPIGKPYSDAQRFLDSFQLIARDRS
jgi:hypothetical protein